MAEAAVRVALLARPGEAREQLRRALADLGAELVAEGDPAELDPGDVAGRSPGVVLVSLDPTVEDSLGRFDALLATPGIEVMYDDAEVTRQLDGWDLARWARHLAAKLVGGDVLPPAPASADQLPEFDLSALQPGAPPTPAQEMAHERFDDYASESVELAEWVPSEPKLAEAPADEPVADAAFDAGEVETTALDLNLDDIALALEGAAADAAASPGDPHAPSGDTAEPPVPDADALPDLDLALDAVAAQAPLADADVGDAPLDFEDAGALPGDAEDSAPLADVDHAPLDFDIDLTALPDEAASPAPAGSPDADAFDASALELDIDLSALPADDAPLASVEPVALADEESLDFDLDLSALPEEGAPMVVAPAEPEDEATPLLADLELPDGPVNFSRFGSDEPAASDLLDDDVAALSAQLDALQAEDSGRPALVDELVPLAGLDDDARATPPAVPPAASLSFGELSLADDDAPMAPAPAAAAPAAAAPPPVPAAAGKGSAFGDLELVPMASNEGPSWAQGTNEGALLVIAGLGGPDAVRQLLSRLPDNLPVPVLLCQRLDTGKHDRLVGQLAKASAWPVDLAEPGKWALPGRVAVLPPDIGVKAVSTGLSFVPGGSLDAVLAALPAATTGVVVLSGADPALAPALVALRGAGGKVWAQEPASCFDPAAAEAVIAAGAPASAPADLPELVRQGWG